MKKVTAEPVSVQIIRFVDTFQLENETLPNAAIISERFFNIPDVAENLDAEIKAGNLLYSPYNLTYAITMQGCDLLSLWEPELAALTVKDLFTMNVGRQLDNGLVLAYFNYENTKANIIGIAKDNMANDYLVVFALPGKSRQKSTHVSGDTVLTDFKDYRTAPTLDPVKVKKAQDDAAYVESLFGGYGESETPRATAEEYIKNRDNSAAMFNNYSE